MAAPSKAFDFSGFVMTRVWDSLGRCQYKTDHYLANRSCVAEHMFKPNRLGISNLFGNVWSLLCECCEHCVMMPRSLQCIS
jgi:hypothetical protein